MLSAIVLAGGGPEPRLAVGLPNKAFLEIAGQPLIRRVVGALQGCAAVERIVVVGPVDALAAVVPSGVQLVPEQVSMVQNIEAGVACLAGAERVLAVASDLPLLTADAISVFLDRCPDDADLCYPVIPQTVIEQRFPGARKTYVKVADGTFCGGSVLVFAVRVLDRVRPLVEQIIAARKKPWMLAQLFGWATVMKFATGRLSIADVEARALDVTGLRGRAVIVESPELALDVDADRPENLAVFTAALSGGARR
ncbi:MAG: nucleotidyltransferase family protein [Armatimonadota bacterium]|nr:nucleotidyltransferase family protein [Armatimonadota bacterium]